MTDWLRYHLERWLLRGAAYRLAVIALVIVLVSVCGGLAVLPLGAPDGGEPFDAVWWAFLRLTDPGYLGDDEGVWKRIVSTALTVGGYVLFMGALIAVMTQSLDATVARLERGETPIVASGHLLVIGWTDRSAAIVKEFLLSEKRVRRFLRRRGQSRLHVVLMVEELSPDIQAEIATRFGDLWDDDVVTLRAGSRLRVEHLERVAFDQAAAIVLPGSDAATDFAGSDIAAIKTLLSIAHHQVLAQSGSSPRVVAEIFDRRKVSLASVAYPGELDVVPSDLHISRLIVQNIRSPGLSHVYGELLTHHRGAAVYAKSDHGLGGLTIAEAAARFDRAVLLGVVRRDPDGRNVAELNTPGDRVVAAEERLVLIAESVDDADAEEASEARNVDEVVVLSEPSRARRVLVLGWSDKFAAMVEEMGTFSHESWSVVVASVVPSAERVATLEGYGPLPTSVEVEHLEADFTLPGAIAGLNPASFENVVLLGSDWLRSDEEADARTLVGYLTLRQSLQGADRQPHVLVEITEPGNAELFDERRGEVVVSPLVVSNLLAHVTLRGEILTVFDTLFSAGGPSLLFRSPSVYGLAGTQSFESIARGVRRRGHVAIGLRLRKRFAAGGLYLVPSRDQTFDLAAHELVVMAPTRG